MAGAAKEHQKKKKLYIKTWGCQMNVYDSKRMADVLRPMGYEAVDEPDNADMMVLNTCHIREKATEKVFSELGRLRKHKDRRTEEGKETLMAVAGCVAQAEGDVITDRAPYVDLVFGPQTYHELPQMVNGVTGELDGQRAINTDFPVESKFDFLPQEETEASGPSAFLSVQEGCDKFCTFCVVPYTRGAEFSRPVEQIIVEAKALVKAGAKEIQLLGQNVNAYHGEGSNGKEWGLGALIKELACRVDGLERIRYTTSHPRDMDDELIQAHGDVPQLMPFLHLPVQSGSDSILKAMNRRHKADLYRRIIDQLREARPDIALSSDFIVGFPGETEDDHKATLDLIDYVRYAFVYSFKYSARPGTPAATMSDQVLEAIKDRRLQELQAMVNQHQREFNQATVGQVFPVLFEREGRDETQIHGRSPYMQSVHVQGNQRLIGEIVPVKVTTAYANSVSGEIVQFELEKTRAAE